jgi:O-antigen ligase
MTFPLPTARWPEITIEHFPSRFLQDSIVFYGVFGLLFLCPLAFGAVEPWSIFLLEAVSAVLFMIWVVQQFFSAERSIRWNPLFPPMLAFAGLVLLQLAAGTTAYRYATLSGGLLYCAYGLLCFLAVQCLGRTSQIRILALSFSCYGFAVATFALLQGLSSNGKLYWLRTPNGGGWIYGSYVNHNHYAGLMEMLFPIPLVFSLTSYARGGMRTSAVLASAVMATTIFLSGSRGGMAAFFCEIIVLLAMLLRQQSRIPFRGRIAFAFFSVLLVSLPVWIGGQRLTERLIGDNSARRELTQGIRLPIDRDLIKMFPHRPLLGWGLGTFGDVYPQYKSFYTNFYLDEAHNDYLQLLIEVGAAGFITMIWFLWLVFRSAAKTMRNWPTNINGAVALAAVLGIVGILAHSLVDFNLQVPANAALFYVLCSIAAMEPRFGHGNTRKIHERTPQDR